MESILNKYAEILKLSKKELEIMIKEILCGENYEYELLELFGEQNFEDVIYMCKNRKKLSCIKTRKFEIFEYERYQENCLEALVPNFPKEQECVPVKRIEGGEEYFKFELFNCVQSATFSAVYETDDNVLVSAPTGSGKTEIAILAIIHALKKGGTQKIVYVAPMKALATEISEKLRKILKVRVCEYTGDTQISIQEAKKHQIFVSTPEKFEVATRRAGNFLQKTLSLVVIDEIHLLQEERGSVLESLVCRIFRYVEYEQRNIRILGMSATLPNAEDVAKFIKAKRLFKFDDTHRATALEMSILGVYQRRRKDGSRRVDAGPRDVHEVCIEKVGEFWGKEAQIIVFVHSRAETVSTALEITRQISFTGQSVKRFKSSLLNELVSKMVGVHHAGLPKGVRSSMESLFLDGSIKVLVSTATLAWGVNLPANCVIIKGTTYYDSQRGNFFEISIADILQMFGRAGRPQFCEKGRALLITTRNRLESFTKQLIEKIPIESQLLHSLVDFLNAEISLGNIENVEDCLNWMRDTFLYVRMAKNPTLYGLGKGENVTDVIKDYAILSAGKLEECKMIEIERNDTLIDYQCWKFRATEFGRIASFHYVSHATIGIWLSRLPKTADEFSLLSLLFESVEFKNVICREEEMDELKELSEDVLVEFDGSSLSKMLVLASAIIKKKKIYAFSLQCDQNYIKENLARLLQALIFITIEDHCFSAFEAALSLRAKIFCINTVNLETKKANFNFIKVGDFMHIKIECIEIEKQFNDNNAYLILKAGNTISEVFLFSFRTEVFVPIRSNEFSICIKAINSNWKFESKFTLNEVKKLLHEEEIDFYGICFLERMHCNFNQINLNNINLVNISNYNKEELNIKIFNIVKKFSNSKIKIFVQNLHERESTIKFLKTQYAIKEQKIFKIQKSCLKWKETQISVETIENFSPDLKFDQVIFKSYRKDNQYFKLSNVFKIDTSITILEKKDFCEFFEYLLLKL